jgi:hypothetical protein
MYQLGPFRLTLMRGTMNYQCIEKSVAAVGGSMRPFRELALAVLCMTLFGCGPKTVWSTTSVSPDGMWIAGARTQMWSGPGTGTVGSIVYLVRARDSREPRDIVGYLEGAESPRPQIEWRSASDLVVRVPNPANLNLQVVKFADIRISVEPLENHVSGSNSSKE